MTFQVFGLIKRTYPCGACGCSVMSGTDTVSYSPVILQQAYLRPSIQDESHHRPAIGSSLMYKRLRHKCLSSLNKRDYRLLPQCQSFWRPTSSRNS